MGKMMTETYDAKIEVGDADEDEDDWDIWC